MDNRVMHDPRNYTTHGVDRSWLGAILLMNLFTRLECGICGPNPIPSRKLSSAVQVIDPGYCIDAPDVMPAGGMTNICLPPDEADDPPIWLPDQQVCDREPAEPTTNHA